MGYVFPPIIYLTRYLLFDSSRLAPAESSFLFFFPFLIILSCVHGALSRRRWAFASPSIQYSMRRNTISMNNVCGHIQPHHTRPNTTVKRITKTKKVIITIIPCPGRTHYSERFPKMICCKNSWETAALNLAVFRSLKEPHQNVSRLR